MSPMVILKWSKLGLTMKVMKAAAPYAHKLALPAMPATVAVQKSGTSTRKGVKVIGPIHHEWIVSRR